MKLLQELKIMSVAHVMSPMLVLKKQRIFYILGEKNTRERKSAYYIGGLIQEISTKNMILEDTLIASRTFG